MAMRRPKTPVHAKEHYGGTTRGTAKMCTPKERAFAHAWAELGDPVGAYKRAYKATMKHDALRANAHLVARRPHVRAAYLKRKAVLDAKATRVAEEKHGVTIDSLLREYAKLGFSNMLDYIDITPDGRPLLNLDKATPEQMAAVETLKAKVLMIPAHEVLALLKAAGPERASVKVPVLCFELKLFDSVRALNAIAKHLGMFDADHRQNARAETEALRETAFGGSAI